MTDQIHECPTKPGFERKGKDILTVHMFNVICSTAMIYEEGVS